MQTRRHQSLRLLLSLKRESHQSFAQVGALLSCVVPSLCICASFSSRLAFASSFVSLLFLYFVFGLSPFFPLRVLSVCLSDCFSICLFVFVCVSVSIYLLVYILAPLFYSFTLPLSSFTPHSLLFFSSSHSNLPHLLNITLLHFL